MRGERIGTVDGGMTWEWDLCINECEVREEGKRMAVFLMHLTGDLTERKLRIFRLLGVCVVCESF